MKVSSAESPASYSQARAADDILSVLDQPPEKRNLSSF
jgi:hypothetical protein